jgi:hypothetical protein
MRKEKEGMKKQKAGVWFLDIAVLSVFLSCASGGGGGEPGRKTGLLDDKGAELEIPAPEWVLSYVAGGDTAVEALAEYKDYYCFVIVSGTSPDKELVLAWVNSPDRVMEIGEAIGVPVSQYGTGELADWWILARNKAAGAEEYEAFGLYIFDKKVLNGQIARNLQDIMDNNAEMPEAERALYADLINEIRMNGLPDR